MSVLLSAANPRKCESKCPFLSLALPVSSQKPKNFLFPQKYNIWRQWLLYFHTNLATLSFALLSVCSHLRYQQWLKLLESIMNISKQRRKRINNCDARRRRINHSVNARHSPVPVPSDFCPDTSQQPLIRQFHRAFLNLKLTGAK